MEVTQTANPDDKLDFKKVLPIFIIVLVDMLGLTIIIPLLHLYAASFGADPLMVGAVATAYPLTQFIGAPLLGGLSDRFGRKPILLISQAGTFIGFLVLGFAGSLIMIFAARIIDGISGANIAAAQAALTDVTTEKTRAQGLGLIGAAFGLGFIVGPIISLGALAIGHNNYAVPAFVAAGFSLLSIVLTSLWFKETLPGEKRGERHPEKSNNPLRNIGRALRNPLIGTLLVVLFAQQVIFFGFENLLGLFTLNRLGMDGRGNAIIFVFVGVIVVLVQGKFIGPWSRKYGERKLIFFGMATLALGMVLTAFTPRQPMPGYTREALTTELEANAGNPGETSSIAVDLPPDGGDGWLGLAWILVAMVPASVGGGLLQPSINTLITKRVSPAEVGTMLGISAAFISAANAITPVLGGAGFDALGSTAPFLIGGIFLFLLLGVALRKITPLPAAAPGGKPAIDAAD